MINQLLWKSRYAFLKFQPSIEIDPSVKISWQADIQLNNGKISIGKRSRIYSGAKILPYGGTITIGSSSTVNSYSILYGHGGLEIGDGVRIAAHCTIVPANHNFEDPDEYIFQQGTTTEGITIEDDVWIGSGCQILDGVTIGRGSVIGAGSVVNENIPPYSIAVGTPAKVIKSRK
jgi:acetyltransferase-like isoleucine patch superfamily enzyme